MSIDDAERVFAYGEPDKYSLNAASPCGFRAVGIKRNWKTIVPR